MNGGADSSSFPLQAVLRVVLVLLVVVVALNLLPHDPTEELPSVSAPDAPRPEIASLVAKRAPDEVRIFAIGASMTAGYPYTPPASYADQLGVGLQTVWPHRTVHSYSYAKPALDSPQLAKMVDRLLRDHDPSLLLVALGSNEFANRIFGGTALVKSNLFDWLADRVSRARKLFRLLPAGGEARSQKEFQTRLEEWVGQSRHGTPWFGGLPVSRADQEMLVARMRRTMRRIARACQRAEVPLVFLVAVYGMGGFWPWGISKGGLNAEVDRLVERTWKRLGPALLPEVDRFLAKWPERADLHFARGLLLREFGEPKDAKAAFERARDLDQVPMHLTGQVLAAIRQEAAALGRPCLVLDEVFQAMARDGIQGPEHYLDYGHLSEEGHRHVAVFLARELARRELLPQLPPGWEPDFRRAARDHVVNNVEALRIALAPTNIAGANGNFSMLFGNFRDAVPYLKRAFGKTPTITLASRLAHAAFDYAGRLPELLEGSEAEVHDRGVLLYGKMVGAVKEGTLDRLIERVLAGEDVFADG